MIEIAMVLVAAAFHIVVPKHYWHAVHVGCTADILEIIVAEEV
jgi:hypothetical protein